MGIVSARLPPTIPDTPKPIMVRTMKKTPWMMNRGIRRIQGPKNMMIDMISVKRGFACTDERD